MSHTTVANIRHLASIGDPDVVRIDRRTKWGNPYVIGRDGDRDAVIMLYLAYLIRERPDLIQSLPELKGKRLACWCSPLACHGDVLANLADALVVSA